jgi:hypothetical protein
MRRSQLETLLRELGRVSGKRELVLIGSQCVHATTDAVPAEVLMSLEVDVLIEEADPASGKIDEELGPDSAFRAEHAVFVDTVPASFPFLPDGFEERLRVIEAGELRARCLEVHDLVLSKLAAGRLKDTEMVAALITYKLADVDTIRARIAAVPDLHMRAILLARLQLVLENVPS